MAKRDLIISCFAVPPQRAAYDIVFGGDWAGNKPVIYNIGKTGEWDLSRLRQLGGGSILTGILNEAMSPARGNLVTEWGRVALVSFSEGTSAARQIMVNPIDYMRLDAFVSLDSTAVAKTMPEYDAQGYGWGQYGDFGAIALDGSALQVMLHTDIVNKNPNVAATSTTAEKVFSYLHTVAAPLDEYAKANGTASPFDFVPGYPFPNLNGGPRFFAGPDANVIIADQVGNNFRLRLPSPIAFTPTCKREGVCQGQGGVMVCDGGVGCAHSACAVDFQRGIYDTFLGPRWRNPAQFACAGAGCSRPGKDTVLSGLGWSSAYGDDAIYVPTTKGIDNDELRATFELLGLPRWDLVNGGAIAAAAAAATAAITYFFMRK